MCYFPNNRHKGIHNAETIEETSMDGTTLSAKTSRRSPEEIEEMERRASLRSKNQTVQRGGQHFSQSESALSIQELKAKCQILQKWHLLVL